MPVTARDSQYGTRAVGHRRQWHGRHTLRSARRRPRQAHGVRQGGQPGHGPFGVAHTEVTGFTCRGAGRSPSGVPCLPGNGSRASRVAPNRTTLIFLARFVTRREKAWARNVGQLIRDIFGAEEEEVAEWIRSLGQLIRAGLGLAFAGITAWSIAALSSEESSFAFGRAEHIGFLVVGVLGLFLLADPPAEQSVLPEQKLRAGASMPCSIALVIGLPPFCSVKNSGARCPGREQGPHGPGGRL